MAAAPPPAAAAAGGTPPVGREAWPRVLNAGECHAVPDVEVGKERLSAKYTGKGNHANDHGSVRSAKPVPRDASIYYFEVTVLDAGYRGAVTVGLSPPNFKLTRQVGTRALSFGYRGDDGRKFSGSSGGRGEPYGPFFNTGDVVGCGVNFYTGEVFFAKNGRSLGPAFSGLPRDAVLYPTVSLHSPGEQVSFNFGVSGEPFRFDVGLMLAGARARVEEEVSRAPADPRACVPLIRAYLAHRGHCETLRAFESLYGFGGAGAAHGSGGGEQDQEMADATPLASASSSSSSSPAAAVRVPSTPDDVYEGIRRRKGVCELVARGSVEAAIASLRSHYPGLLDANRELLFQLHCQQFVEIVRESRVDEALAYVRGQLAAYKGDSQVPHEQLSATIGMLAYVDVAASPAAYLLEQGRRDDVADRVNSAILSHQGQPARPALETLVRQLKLAHRQLRREERVEI